MIWQASDHSNQSSLNVKWKYKLANQNCQLNGIHTSATVCCTEHHLFSISLSNITVTLNFESRDYFHREKSHRLETRTTSDLCLTVHEKIGGRSSKEHVIKREVSRRTFGKSDLQTYIVILGHIFM